MTKLKDVAYKRVTDTGANCELSGEMELDCSKLLVTFARFYFNTSDVLDSYNDKHFPVRMVPGAKTAYGGFIMTEEQRCYD